MGKRILSLDGKITPVGMAKVSVFDRAYMFGDGVYEVIRIYDKRPFALEKHLERLQRSLDLLEMKDVVDMVALESEIAYVMDQADLENAIIYIHVSRGVPREFVRTHTFEQPPFDDAHPGGVMDPSITVLVSPYDDSNAALRDSGCKAITARDMRWLMCEVKSLNLLGNVFAAQAAKVAGAEEAILVNDAGHVTEGSRTNVFAVVNGVLRTAPTTANILHGVTRQILLDLVKEPGTFQVVERSLWVDELHDAEEVFLTGTTTEVMPVVMIDGKPVGNGQPGNVTRQLQRILENYRIISS